MIRPLLTIWLCLAACTLAAQVSPKQELTRLFQLADLICTLHLIELKLRAGVKLSRSENQFFGGPQMFRHNILRYIKAKEV